MNEEPDANALGREAQKRFFLLLGAGVPALLGLAFLWHSCATSGGDTVLAQGKLVRRAGGSPVAGAALYASETPLLVLTKDPKAGGEAVVLGGSQAEPLREVGRTESDGSFRIQVPDSPEATILAVHGELAAALTRVSELKTIYEAGLPIESPCGLVGEAFDPLGSPLANTFVSLVPYGGKEKPRWQTWTDAEGKFRFSRLPAGRLTVSILYPRTVDPVNAEFTASSVVRVAAGEESYIHFGPSGSIVGKVKDGDGKTIPDAELQVRTTGTSAEGRLAAHLRTRAGGDFKIYGLPAFTYRAFVRNPNRGEEPAWFDGGDLAFPRAQEKWQDLQLAPVQLKIRIAPESSDYKFPETLPKLKRAPVRRMILFPKDASQPSYDLTSDMKISSDGKSGVFDPQYQVFQIPHVPAGIYTAVCQVEGYGAGVEEDIVVPAQGTVPMKTLTVTRGGPVVVQVNDQQDKPVPHAIVSMWWEDKLEFVRGAPGEELCPGPGTFMLRVEADGYKTQRQKFFVLVATQKNFSVKLEAE